MDRAQEVNFDGIVGPTHNYAGLSFGNVASHKHALTVSHPKEAALQGLAKMKYLADLGLTQAVLPPHERPDLGVVRLLGFRGSDAQVIQAVAREDRRLLASVYSASAMWAANAATVSPSPDTPDGRVHFTPANLVTQFHRSLEPPTTYRVLRKIFAEESAFVVHEPLPATTLYADEGAANHTRLCETYASPGIEMFVYGRGALIGPSPRVFPARQTFESCTALARLHQLDPASIIFARQNPNAVDAGVFHNDVVAVGNQNVLLYNARAYADSESLMQEVRSKFAARSDLPLHLIEVTEAKIPLATAIETYLFNSQLVTLPDGGMSLIAPVECQENPTVNQFVRELIDGDNPIQSVHYLDVRQSMKNGGGPACLRLRVVLTERELSLVHRGVLLDDPLYSRLTRWVERHYRQTLGPEDLADPKLLDECRSALDELTGILGIGTVYAFQG